MSPKNETNLKELPYNSNNPFIEDVVEHISTSKQRKVSGWKWQTTVDETTGDMKKEPMLVLGDIKEVDSQEWYKLYHGSIKSFFGLPNSAMLVFDYIMKHIKYDNDRVCLHYPDMIETIKLSKPTIYRALAQLILAKIIAKADMNGCYFINPNIAFKGDRITLVKQFVRKKDNSQLSEPEIEYQITKP